MGECGALWAGGARVEGGKNKKKKKSGAWRTVCVRRAACTE